MPFKLSDLYNAPKLIFIETAKNRESDFAYSHNSFAGSNAYVHNLYQHDIKIIEMLVSAKEEEIKVLKEEINWLREQNNLILSRLIEDK